MVTMKRIFKTGTDLGNVGSIVSSHGGVNFLRRCRNPKLFCNARGDKKNPQKILGAHMVLWHVNDREG